jgi:O-antigen ligase
MTTGVIILVASILAITLGVVSAAVDPGIALLFTIAMLPVPFILHDFRFGVALLVVIIPSTTLLPSVSGLNVLNYLVITTLVSFAVKHAFKRSEIAWLPKELLFFFLLPVTMAIIVAWPRIPEAARNYWFNTNASFLFDPPTYVVTRYIKPIFYYLSFAFLLANAVRLSRRPERFLTLFAVASVAPAAAVIYGVVRYPGPLADVVSNRMFMEWSGMHANDFGMLLAFFAGPLLFVFLGTRDHGMRLLCFAAFLFVTIGLLLTFSRGGALAYGISMLSYLVFARRVRMLLVLGAFVCLSLFAAPDILVDRLTTGLRWGALSDVSNEYRDDLTAGRVANWVILSSEIFESPILGQGMGSTQWSSAVTMGRYRADHPHNIYLEILMDIGILGLVAFILLFRWYFRVLQKLVASAVIPSNMLLFFKGVRASIIGMLAMAATHAYYMPNPAQGALWIALGLMFGYLSASGSVDPLANRAVTSQNGAVAGN